MRGPGAVLDCMKNTIMSSGQIAVPEDPADGSIGIFLENGARAINCNVAGFYTGVYMQDGNNILENSKVGGAASNIYTAGRGCMVVDNVESTNGLNGLAITHDGTMQVYNSRFSANEGPGILTFDPTEVGDVNICFSANNVVSTGNGAHGIALTNEGRAEIKHSELSYNVGNGLFPGSSNLQIFLEDTETIGNADGGIAIPRRRDEDDLENIEINTYGTVSSLGNRENGLDFICESNCELNVLGELVLEGNGDVGLESENLDVTVPSCASLKACGNLEFGGILDIDDRGGSSFEGDVICSSKDSAALESCEPGCNDIGEGDGIVCKSPITALCFPKPEW
mmetsp:Transcript_11950/g.19183  ORF Transcript_11950/g.19183 Transcript_11950/m.19183 type:complete len:339 (-) Transcript_11950:93-1109(-)